MEPTLASQGGPLELPTLMARAMEGGPSGENSHDNEQGARQAASRNNMQVFGRPRACLELAFAK
ncbi:hypothetical protein EJ110_NYTH39759 [Nymphaea thermarum]|nr:hypothetical protein EJ110_NYTH39759 [Nymphaea thermarum]